MSKKNSHDVAFTYFGVDVSKSHLDVATCEDCKSQRMANTPDGIHAIVLRMAAADHPMVVLEASGGYEKDLLDALEQAGIPFRLVNPRNARNFARACGVQAKNDNIDARMLARFGLRHQLLPQGRPAAAIRRLADLEQLRDDLIKNALATECRIQQSRDAFIRKTHQDQLRALHESIAEVDREIEASVTANEEANALRNAYQQVKGVGPRVSTKLVALMPELGRVDRRQIASLAGVAPFDCESGAWKGKRSCHGGRRVLRKNLYMAALVASRYNEHAKAFYSRLVQNGKPKKVALMAVARKLLCHLNSIASAVLKALNEPSTTS